MIKFLPFDRDGLTEIIAFDGDNSIGSCSFITDGFFMTFNSVDCSDDIITEGLARSAMNYAANRNVYIAKINKALKYYWDERLGNE